MPSAMHEFLRQHSETLLQRWEAKARAQLPCEKQLTHEQLRDSLSLFLDEIIEGLEHMAGKLVEGQQSALARVHGGQRQHLGGNIAELVREYGVLYECVIELHAELGTIPSLTALRELSKCLFTGASEAVEEFAVHEEASRQSRELKHFGFIAHEIRNPLWSARMAWDLVQRDRSLEGHPAGLLSRSLTRVAQLIDETLTTARLSELGQPQPSLQKEPIHLTTLLAEAEADSSGDALVKRVELLLHATDGLALSGDYRVLLSALTNLIRNAVKFTPAGGTVIVRSLLKESRVLIEVRDQCGGLPPDRAERLFEVFTQANQNRSGFGLGLAIAKQAVEAHGGTISVKNVPNKGCIFFVDLPSHPA